MKIVNAMSGQHEDKVHYKVLKALLDVDVNDEEKVNLSYLADVPVKCLPRVLEMVQEYMAIDEGLGFLGMRRSHPPCIVREPCPADEMMGRLLHVLRGIPALFEHGVSSASAAKTGGHQRKRRRKCK